MDEQQVADKYMCHEKDQGKEDGGKATVSARMPKREHFTSHFTASA